MNEKQNIENLLKQIEKEQSAEIKFKKLGQITIQVGWQF